MGTRAQRQTPRVHEAGMLQLPSLSADDDGVRDGKVYSAETKNGLACILRCLCLEPGKRYPFFLYFEPTELAFGTPRTMDVVFRDMDSGCVLGGSTYNLALVKGEESEK